MPHFFKLLSLAVIVVLLVREGSAQARLARLIDGSEFEAALVDLDSDWNLTLQQGDAKRVVAADDLLSWGAFRDREGSPLIILSDGGMLAADVLGITRGRVTVKPKPWQQQDLPLEAVRGVIFRPPADPLERDRLVFAIQSATGSRDELLLNNGDRIAGVLVSGEDNDSGSFRLETNADEYNVPRTKVTAVTFNPALVTKSKPRRQHAWVGFRDGSLLLVDQVARDENRLTLSLPAGVTLQSYPDRLLRLLREFHFIQPASSRITYLSEVQPLPRGYKSVSFLDTTWPYRTDRNVLGGRLRASGNTYLKGLGMHSASRLAYSVDQEYHWFLADLAIDDAAGKNGSVQFQVIVDRGSGWESGTKSKTLRGGDPPTPIRVDLADVQRMVLIVSFADRGDSWDHANWLNARFAK